MESWFEEVGYGMRKKLWCSLSFAVIWSLWSFKNAIIFKNKSVNWEEFLIILKRNWCYKAEECVSILGSGLDKIHNGGVNYRGSDSEVQRRKIIVNWKEANMRKKCCWTFVDYLVEKQAYAVGVWLQRLIYQLIAVSFKREARSLVQAEIIAIKELVQYAL